jgi:hypothetical protein
MALYSITNSTGVAAQVAVTTTDISLVAIIASTIAPAPVIQLSRAKIYDLLVGTVGTPADNSMYWSVQRATAGSTPAYAGYASSINTALDQADATTKMAVITNSSIETSFTYTATNYPWYVGVNQRASYRWVAAPGSEIVLAATSSAGAGLRVRSPAYTGNASGTVFWSE